MRGTTEMATPEDSRDRHSDDDARATENGCSDRTASCARSTDTRSTGSTRGIGTIHQPTTNDGRAEIDGRRTEGVRETVNVVPTPTVD